MAVRISLAEEQARVAAVRARLQDITRVPWAGELRWCSGRVTVALPWLREVVSWTPTGEDRTAWRVPDTHGGPSAYDELRVDVRGELVAIAESRLQSHGGDRWVALHLAVDRPSPVTVEVDDHNGEHEMRWAISPNGTRVVTTDVDRKRSRLVAIVRDAEGHEERRFTVGGEDELACDAVAIDDDGARVAVAAEAAVIVQEGRKKRTWERHAWLRSIHFATVIADVLGLQDGERGVVWMMRGKQKPPVIGAALPADASPVTALAIAPDETYAYWQARRADGTPAVLRIGLRDGVTELAEHAFGAATTALALDPACGRIAWLEGTDLVIDAFEPAWTAL